MVNGILTTTQASDANVITSVWQWLYTEVKPTYDTQALAAGFDQGTTTNRDYSFTQDTLGLGIVDDDIDRDDFNKRVPVISVLLDDGKPTKAPQSTGCGDGSNNEWWAIKLRCVPAVTVSSAKVVEANKAAMYLLRTAVWNAIGRSFIIPIVDSTAARVSNLYPQIGYAEISNATLPKRPAFKSYLIVDRRDFDVTFNLRIGVQTQDGL